MKSLLLNPYAWLIVVVVSLALLGGGYWWGHTAAATSCTAKAGTQVAKVKGVQDTRDEHVEAIAAATASAVAAQLNQNRSTSDASVETIRTIVVPGACRAADPVIVRELQDGADGINAALRAGLRSGPAGAGGGRAVNTP